MRKVFIIIPIVLAIIGTGVFMAVRMERKERHAAKAMELERQAKREALRAEAETLTTEISERVEDLLRHADVVKRASMQSRLSSAFLAGKPELKKAWPAEPPEGPHQELTAEIAAGALAAIAVEGRRLLKDAPKLAAKGQALVAGVGPRTSLKELGEVVEEMRSLDQRLADSTGRMNANVRLVEALGTQLEESTMAKARARNAAKTDVHRELEARAYQKLAAQEVAAVEKLIREMEPGLICDLHEGNGQGFWMPIPRPEQDADLVLDMTRAYFAYIDSRDFPVTDYEDWQKTDRIGAPDPDWMLPEPTLPGMFWLNQDLRAEGHNLMSFASPFGIGYGTEAPMIRPLAMRVDGITEGMRAAIGVWEKGV